MAFTDDWGAGEWAGAAFLAFLVLGLVLYLWFTLRKKPPEHLLALERK